MARAERARMDGDAGLCPGIGGGFPHGHAAWAVLALAVLALGSVAWGNTVSTMPMVDGPIDMLMSFLTSKWVFGAGTVMILGMGVRAYMQSGHGQGMEYYGLIMGMLVVGIIIGAPYIMTQLGYAAEPTPYVEVMDD